MLRRLLTLGWLVGVPTLLTLLNYHTYLYGLTLNVGPETAARIHPGMRVAEVERLIGSPPGEYRYSGATRFFVVSVGCGENRIEWFTGRGRLVLVDGHSGRRCPNSSDGVVDDVRWEPSDDGRWASEVVTFAVGCFAIAFCPFAVYLRRRLPGRHYELARTDPVAGDRLSGLPAYPG